MCDYLERMKKINVPTEEIRLWSGLAHRVIEYTSPFPIPEDVVIMLWLHEESATILLDMCDDIDEKFSELEIENAKLRKAARDAWSLFVRFGAVEPYNLPEVDRVRESLKELGIDVSLQELGIEVRE